MRRGEGGANIFGVFRVKNHDFTPKNHIFSNCGGRRENLWGISCEKSRFYAKKIIFFPILGGARAGCAPLWIRPWNSLPWDTLLCVTLTERNTQRFVQNWRLPRSPSTEWSWLIIEFVFFSLFTMQLDYCNIQRVSDQR